MWRTVMTELQQLFPQHACKEVGRVCEGGVSFHLQLRTIPFHLTPKPHPTPQPPNPDLHPRACSSCAAGRCLISAPTRCRSWRT